jgi:hypothetical protein
MKIPKSKSRKNSAYTVTEVFVVIMIMATLSIFVFSEVNYQKTELPNEYAAWVKMTGNPNNLTFEEWKSLTENERRFYRSLRNY